MSGPLPVFFVPDLLSPVLEINSIYHQPFEKLSNSHSLLEVDERKIKLIQLKLIEYNQLLEFQAHQEEITCAFTSKGAFWLKRTALQSAIDSLQQVLDSVRQKKKLPIWRLTSSEIMSFHSNNLRHLVQSFAYDSIVLGDLKEYMNGRHNLLTQDLGELRKKVMRMIKGLKEHNANRISVEGKYFDQLERCRITRMLMIRGEMNESQLGYTQAELCRAEEFLEDRCQNILPHFQKHLQKVYESVLTDLLEGERLQFVHAKHWADIFYELGDPPEGYWGVAQLAFLEREGHDAFMSTRLEELESCEYCREIVQFMQQQYAEAYGLVEEAAPPDLALTDEEIEMLIAEFQKRESELPSSPTEPDTKEKSRHLGMAYLDRIR